MSPFAAALERALSLRAAGDDVAFMAALLEAWRLVPDEELAELADEVARRLSRKLARARGYPSFSHGHLKRRRWLAVAELRRPEDVPWILNALAASGWGGGADLALLAELPPDARIARILPLYRLWFGGRAPAELDALEARHRLAPAPAPPETRALLDRLLGPLRDARATERALLQEIWRDPGADGPRLVYADWLRERDEPRGELIGSQFPGGATSQRNQYFEWRYLREWFPGIAPVLGSVTFARGFPEVCAVRGERLALEAATGSPEWATVTKILFWGGPGDAFARLVTHPVMGHLHDLRFVDAEVLAALLATEPPPRLQSFGCQGPCPDEDVLAHPLFQEPQRLSFMGTLADAATWLRRLARASLPNLVESTFTTGQLHVSWHRGVLEVTHAPTPQLAELLEALPDGTLAGVRLAPPREGDPDWPRLVAAAARLGGLRS